MKRNKINENNEVTIFIVATPIGNLNEINQRTIEVLNEVDYILCEDTRVSSKLLNHLKIKNKKLESYHLHNEYDKLDSVIKNIKEYKKVALISDAGYPLISDPGYILVQNALNENINIVVINGSNALLPALICSGFKTQPFTFIGFVPNKKSEAIKYLEQFINCKHTLILYESIHHLSKTLKLICDVFGNVPLSISREITKLNEEHIYGSANDLLNADLQLKGELVICLDNSNIDIEVIDIDDDFIEIKVNEMINENVSKKNAIKQVSKKYGLEKNHVYNVVHKRK
ncbi:16S rRNA (cytidine1402-2'-O)-methyltransferase [Bacilli bacterium PM5-3]|nr:16S rRNA (cytidine1402-2'-O)-methyltransferase [Bacilli bacterium PM5-3]MDH6603681.1 16S rRNA (cytidine1402-2'-O)-methyltransferase [Bacilli bacterium PM5-9]